MKMFRTDSFITERAKVRPITNVEWEKIKDRMAIEVPVSSISNVNDIEVGWLVVVRNKVRVTISYEYGETLFAGNCEETGLLFVTSKGNCDVTYLSSRNYEDTFPENMFKNFRIDRIYKYHIPNLKDICKNKTTFGNWFEKQDFDYKLNM